MDEVTSVLDMNIEKDIFKMFEVLMKGKIIIVVVYRFFMVWNCDNIVVLEDGKVVEYGLYD